MTEVSKLSPWGLKTAFHKVALWAPSVRKAFRKAFRKPFRHNKCTVSLRHKHKHLCVTNPEICRAVMGLRKGKPVMGLRKGKPVMGLRKGKPVMGLRKGKPVMDLRKGKAVMDLHKDKGGLGDKEVSSLCTKIK